MSWAFQDVGVGCLFPFQHNPFAPSLVSSLSVLLSSYFLGQHKSSLWTWNTHSRDQRYKTTKGDFKPSLCTSPQTHHPPGFLLREGDMAESIRRTASSTALGWDQGAQQLHRGGRGSTRMESPYSWGLRWEMVPVVYFYPGVFFFWGHHHVLSAVQSCSLVAVLLWSLQKLCLDLTLKGNWKETSLSHFCAASFPSWEIDCENQLCPSCRAEREHESYAGFGVYGSQKKH